MKPIKLTILTALIFAVGFYFGYFISASAAEKRIKEMAPGALNSHLQQLSQNIELELKLNDAQLTKIKAIISNSLEKMGLLRLKVKKEGMLILAEIDLEIEKILSKQELANYREIRKSLYNSTRLQAKTGS